MLGGPDTIATEKVEGSEGFTPMIPSVDAFTTHAGETEASAEVDPVAFVPNSVSQDPMLYHLEHLTLQELNRNASPPPVVYSISNSYNAEREMSTWEKCDTRNLTDRGGKETIRPIPDRPITKSGESYTKTLPVRWTMRVNSVKSQPVMSLFDTGASLSIMSKSEFEKHFSHDLLANRNAMDIKGLGRDRSLGTIITTIFLETTDNRIIELDVEFHVVDGFDVGYCVGNEVMSSYNIDTLISESKAYIPSVDAKVEICIERPKQSFWAVRLSEDTIIPARHFQSVPIDFKSKYLDVDHFFDPGIDVHLATGAMGLCSKALISGSAKRLIYTNFGDRPIELSKGTILGHAHTLSASDISVNTGELFHLDQAMGHVHNAEKSDIADLDMPEIDVQRKDRQIAVIPDGEDRYPEPHSGDPTYKMFDVAGNSKGIPHPEICKVLDDNMDAFSLDGKPGRVSDGTKMIIKTNGDALIPEPARRVGPEKAKVIKNTVQQLLDWQVIEPSDSRVSYPLVVVMQNGKWRMCVDYRRLNQATEADRYPMQRIDEVFDSLHGMLFFSVMDAIRGYHNIPIDELDKWKTAFICAEGLFHWNFMPFGLKTAPAIFQQLIDRISGSLRGRSVLAYIDDILLFTQTLIEHCRDLDTLLKSIAKSGLRLSPSKCHFGYSNLGLLGRRVGRDGLQIDRHKAQAVLDIQPPRTMEELYHVNGLFGHYRMFIYNYAKIAAPLTSATSGNKFRDANGKLNGEWKQKRVDWNPECQKAFDTLKQIISNPPILAFPDLSLRFYVYVDASKKAFAFAIHQRFPKAKPQIFVGLGTDSDETTQKWVNAIKHDNLFGKIYENVKDHADYAINSQGLLIVRSDGDKICVPRSKVHEVCHDCHNSVGHPGFARTWHLMKQIWYRPKLYGALTAYIANCPECLRNKVSRIPRPGEMPEESQIEPIAFKAIAMDFVTALPDDNGFNAILTIVDLWTKAVILIPCTEKYTAESVANMFIQNVIRRGFLPSRFVTDRDKVFMSNFWKALTTSMRISTSFTSPYHAQSDPAERYNQTVETALRTFTADRSSWVESLLWVEVSLNSLKSEATGFTPYELLYNNATGPFTDIHRGLIRQSSQVDDVDDIMIIAKERIKDAKDAIAKAHRSAKHYYDKRHSPIKDYQVGDWAFIRLDLRPLRMISSDSSKLTSPKLGPFKIIEASKRSVKLDLPSNMKVHPVFSVQHLERSPAPGSDLFNRELRPPPIEVVDGVDVYEVEKLLAKRLFGRKKFIQYKVKWKDYPDSEATWVFRDDLIEDGLQDLVDSFDKDLESPSRTRTIRGRDGAIPSRRSRLPRVHAADADPIGDYEEKPVWFESRVTRSYEKGYESLELELACITWTILKAQKYLDGSAFTVYTDHANMKSVLLSKTETLYSRQVNKFRILLQPWLSQIEFIHKPGKLHRNVDALSRLIPADSDE